MIYIEHIANDLSGRPLFGGGKHGPCQTFLSHMLFNLLFNIIHVPPPPPAKKENNNNKKWPP